MNKQAYVAVTPPKSSSFASVLVNGLRDRFVRNRGNTIPDEELSRGRGFIITMCVLIAVVLWFTLSIGETYSIAVNLYTRIINVPEDMALTALPPPVVQVQLRGEGTALFRLRFNPPVLDVDAEQDQLNVNTLVTPPQGIVVENVFPPTLNLRKEPRIFKKVPILSRAVLEPTKAYDFFEPPTLTPDSVVISGAQSIINAIEDWPTETQEYLEVQDSLIARLSLIDSLGVLVTKSHTETVLSTVAHEFSEQERDLKVEVTEFPTALRGVELVPSTIKVSYRVPVSQYQAARVAPDFYATVSYNVIRTDTTGRVRPEIFPPEELSIRSLSWSPTSLRYYVSLIE